MVVFPEFSQFYETWRKDLVSRGVNVRLSTEMTRVIRRDKSGVLVGIKKRTPVQDGHNPNEGEIYQKDMSQQESEEQYDEIVFCCLADTNKRLLDKAATWREKQVLGSCKFSDDITITHNDSDYMKKHYTNFYDENQAVTTLSRVDQTTRCEMAKKSFRPMYYIKMYPSDKSKLEMSFDCTNYQAQFPSNVPFESHVFQTIYLNKSRDSHLWPIDEIAPTKILRKDWWHQLCHSYTHYFKVVPWMMFLQAKHHTRYAAAWTLVNAHEVAIISGIAAAVDLGADYPADLQNDKFALLSFRLYYLLAYGKWYRKRQSRASDGVAREGENWASGLYGSVYQGPGVATEERSIWREEMKLGKSLPDMVEGNAEGRSQS